MNIGKLAVLGVAIALAFGGIGVGLADWRSSDPGQPIDLAGDFDARKNEADDDVPLAADDDRGDGDDTQGDDGTNGGNNTGDGDNTRGNDGTNGGNNTGDGDNTRGNDGTNGGDNTGGGGGGDTDTGGGGDT